MNKRSWHIINLVVLVLLVCGNLFIYLERDNGFAYVGRAGYHQLYNHKDEPTVKEIRLHGDSVYIYTGGPAAAWRENGQGSYLQPAGTRLRKGKNLYHFESRKGDRLTVGFNFVSSEDYKTNNRQRDNVLELYYSSIPVTETPLYSLGEWLYTDKHATAAEKTQALSLISAGMGIGPAERSDIKTLKTAGYILQFLDNKRGIPAQFMDSISPMQRLNAALSGRSKVWCGDFASIFAYFMLLEGVPCRLVTLEGKTGDALKAGHVFNEVYLKENRQWALVDLTSKTLFVKNQSGELLNAQQLFAAHFVSPGNLQITTFKGQLLENEPYEQVKGFYDYYFQSNSHFVYYLRSQFLDHTYSVPEKFRRYFFASPTFLVFDQGSAIDNRRFYIKQAFALALILFVLYWCVSFVITRKKTAV